MLGGDGAGEMDGDGRVVDAPGSNDEPSERRRAVDAAVAVLRRAVERAGVGAGYLRRVDEWVAGLDPSASKPGPFSSTMKKAAERLPAAARSAHTAFVQAIDAVRTPVGRASVKECCKWFSLEALNVLRMTSREWQTWTTACERLGTMPLLGPTGQPMGTIEPARVCSVYTPADGGAPYYLHPEFVDDGVRGGVCSVRSVPAPWTRVVGPT